MPSAKSPLLLLCCDYPSFEGPSILLCCAYPSFGGPSSALPHSRSLIMSRAANIPANASAVTHPLIPKSRAAHESARDRLGVFVLSLIHKPSGVSLLSLTHKPFGVLILSLIHKSRAANTPATASASFSFRLYISQGQPTHRRPPRRLSLSAYT